MDVGDAKVAILGTCFSTAADFTMEIKMAFKKTQTRASNSRMTDRKLNLESLEVRCMLTASGFSSGSELMGPLRPEGQAPLEEFIAPVDTDDADPSSEFLAARTLEVFKLQSKPESNFTIFIDFDGHTSEGASWNNSYGIDSIYHPPYDIDGDDSWFNETELARMETAWRRTAEDFAAFDVNVTTIDPGVEALTRVGAADTRWGIRTVATRDTFAACGCGGHAFIGSFTDDDDTAALVYNRGNGSLGETISHEVGHALRLSHDGLGGVTYYPGHGSGNTSWGSIMGAPFNERITHWDQGEYFGANNIGGGANYSNGFNDLDVITTRNGFGYRADDHGNSIATASELDVANGTALSAFGIIERNDDVDYFEFESPGGDVTLNFSAIEGRPNLDIWAGLYDENGTLVLESNPDNDQSAILSTSLTAGTWYVKVDGVGSHGVYNPATDTVEDPSSPPWQNDPPTGYSDYGSLGQYWISGTIGANTDTFRVDGTNPDAIEGDGATSVAEFVVTRSSSLGSASVEYSVDALMPAVVGGSYPNVASAADFVGGSPSGILNFANGETSKTLSFEVVGDTVYEPDEFFVVRLSNASAGWDMAQSTAIGSIVTNESLVQLSSQSIIASSQPEGDPFADSVTLRWRQVAFSSNNSDNWGLDNVSLSNSTFGDDFQGGIDDSQWGRIQSADVNNTFAGGSASLFFTSDGVREATTRIENPSPGDVVSFDLIFGNTINGGEDADAGEDVVLEFSNDNGTSWQLLERYDTEDYVTWTTIDVALPAEIATARVTEYSVDIERFGDVSQAATVDWQVSVAGVENPVNSADFVGNVIPSGVATFAPGDSIVPITIYVNRDINPELDEQFRVELASADSSNLISVNPVIDSVRRTIIDDESSVGTRAETRFRWRQVASAGSVNSDAWALDNIVIASDGFSDDFDPNIDNSMWSNVTGTVANNFTGGTRQ